MPNPAAPETPARMPAPPAPQAGVPPAPDTTILPTLFGEGYGLYNTKPITFVFSFVGHTVLVVLVVWSSMFVVSHRKQIQQQVVGIVTDISPYVLPASATKAGGGGGGGD